MALDQYRGGSGEPLVLIHGIGHTWRGWKPMLPLLERDFEVLAVDLPGFGRSPSLPPGTEATPEALADAVEGAMDEAGFQKAVLCGNSLGGWIALELARRGRAAVRGRHLPGRAPAQAGEGLGKEHPARHAMGRPEPAGPRRARPKPSRLDPVRGPRGRPPVAPRPERLRRGAAPVRRSARASSTRCPIRFEGQPEGLNEIDVPVRILWGTRDLLLLPRQAKRFERLIPNAELRYLKGLGHTPMSDDPELLAELVATTSRAPRAEAPA